MAASMSHVAEIFNSHKLEVIEELSRITGDPKVDSPSWACLWVADIARLRILTEKARCDENFANLMHVSLDTTHSARMLKTWLSRADQLDSTAHCNGCLGRDDATCLLTGLHDDVKTAPIVPFALQGYDEDNKDTNNFWICLRGFWHRGEVSVWQDAIMNAKNPAINQICLDNGAHELWMKARFALQPFKLSEDSKALTVKFFWLPRMDYTQFRNMTYIPPSFTGHDDKTGVILFRLARGKPLQSGDILTFRTINPSEYPLPSFELLRLQWMLNRVLALSGLVDVTDDDPHPYSSRFGWLDETGSEEVSEEVSEEEDNMSDGRRGL